MIYITDRISISETEIQEDISSFNAQIEAELLQADVKIIRQFIASFDGDQEAIDKVAQHKIDQAALRAKIKE